MIPAGPQARLESRLVAHSVVRRARTALMFLLVCLSLVGCGTMRDHTATQQLLLSDAVDRSVAHIDFSPLQGERVFLDTKYLTDAQKSTFLVKSNYIISSLRQQMMSAGCLIEEKLEDADFVVEARVGTLGADGHDVNYGLQGSGALTAAAAVALTSTPALPTLPEVSLARKTEDAAVAKIALFAYRRESREPVWQSGVSLASSKAQRRWILGAGPFQSGQVYAGTDLTGEHLKANPFSRNPNQMNDQEDRYRTATIYDSRLREKMINRLELSGDDATRVAQRDQTAATGDDQSAAASPDASNGPVVVTPTNPSASQPAGQ
jgi:hypothetical protein